MIIRKFAFKIKKSLLFLTIYNTIASESGGHLHLLCLINKQRDFFLFPDAAGQNRGSGYPWCIRAPRLDGLSLAASEEMQR